MANNPRPDDKLTLQQAKQEYNLTAALIKLLPAPEVMSRGRGLRPYKLWRRSDIETMLASPEAQPHIAVRDAKQVAAAKANLTKEERRVLEAINEIKVFQSDLEIIVLRASQEDDNAGKDLRYMHVLELPEGFPPREIIYTDQELKNALRLILRHLVDYNSEWFVQGLSKDSPEYYIKYRCSVLDAISRVYPELKDVCEQRKKSFC